MNIKNLFSRAAALSLAGLAAACSSAPPQPAARSAQPYTAYDLLKELKSDDPADGAVIGKSGVGCLLVDDNMVDINNPSQGQRWTTRNYVSQNGDRILVDLHQEKGPNVIGTLYVRSTKNGPVIQLSSVSAGGASIYVDPNDSNHITGVSERFADIHASVFIPSYERANLAPSIARQFDILEAVAPLALAAVSSDCWTPKTPTALSNPPVPKGEIQLDEQAQLFCQAQHNAFRAVIAIGYRDDKSYYQANITYYTGTDPWRTSYDIVDIGNGTSRGMMFHADGVFTVPGVPNFRNPTVTAPNGTIMYLPPMFYARNNTTNVFELDKAIPALERQNFTVDVAKACDRPLGTIGAAGKIIGDGIELLHLVFPPAPAGPSS